MTQSERAARPETFPARRARRSRTTRSGRTFCTPRRRFGPSGPWRSRKCRIGRSCGRPARDQGRCAALPRRLLVELEAAVTAAGGVVHWARDAAEANAIVTDSCAPRARDEVVKVKSLATDEIGLNEALEAAGITRSRPTWPSYRAAGGRAAVAPPRAGDPQEPDRDPRSLPRAARTSPDSTDDPARADGGGARVPPRGLPPGARGRLGRELRVADTGSIVVVESEGNGRMCTTLPGSSSR